jgi:plasmid stabilization system protein ParE
MKGKQFSIELSDEAEIDFDKSYEYYYKENPNIAKSFFNRINLSLENLKENPTIFPDVYKGLRKYVVKKFPFVIYYQIEGTVVKVVAIFHTSRNPKIWNDCL